MHVLISKTICTNRDNQYTSTIPMEKVGQAMRRQQLYEGGVTAEGCA